MRGFPGIAAVVVAAIPALAAQAAAPAQVPPVPAGEVLPPWTFPNLNAGVAGADRFDLATVLGKKPVVFCYWLPAEPRSEQVLRELSGVVEGIGTAKVALVGIVNPDLGGSEDAFRARVKEMKLQVPVLRDVGFR